MDSEFVLPQVAFDAFGFTKHQSAEDYAEFWQDDIEQIKSIQGDDSTARAVAEHLTHRVCSVPDVAAAGGDISEARFPDMCAKQLKIYVDWSGWNESQMNMRRNVAREEYDRALSDWVKTVDLKWEQTRSRSEAHCTVDFARLDGNTLAWSHLANNTCGKGFQQRYDIRRWTRHYFYLVALHELGHLLGLPHNRGNFIMNPYIVTQLDGLTNNDITRARDLGYGAPETPPKPEPPSPNPVRIVIPESVVTVDGKRAGVLRFHPDASQPDSGGSEWDV